MLWSRRRLAVVLAIKVAVVWQLGMCKTWTPQPDAPALGWCEDLALWVVVGAAGWVAYALTCKLTSARLKDGEHLQTGSFCATDSHVQERGQPAAAHVQILDMCSGRKTRSNPTAPIEFDSEVGSGAYCLLHRPLDADFRDEDPLAHYFQGKKRLWEVRFQITFKQAVAASTMRFGTAPVERIPVGVRQVAVHRFIITSLGPAMHGFYNSPGDDPAGREPEDVEPPITSIPIQDADQHLCTHPGEPTPGLLDPSFASFGMRKTTDRRRFTESLQERVFQPGETHTFAFWGPSRLVDLIKWRVVGLPMADFSMDALNGPPPIVLSVYVLEPPITRADGRRDHRHLPARMKIVARACGWSSQYPPPPDKLRRLEAIIGRPVDLDTEEQPADDRGVSRWSPPAASRRPPADRRMMSAASPSVPAALSCFAGCWPRGPAHRSKAACRA